MPALGSLKAVPCNTQLGELGMELNTLLHSALPRTQEYQGPRESIISERDTLWKGQLLKFTFLTTGETLPFQPTLEAKQTQTIIIFQCINVNRTGMKGSFPLQISLHLPPAYFLVLNDARSEVTPCF